LATECLDGSDGICEFRTNTLSSTQCPGNQFSMYYICLPLKTHIIDVCYGLPGSMCYEDSFRSTTSAKYTPVMQAGGGTLQLPNSGAYKDQLVWNSPTPGGTVPPPALALVINDVNAPSWKNYRVTANFKIDNPDYTKFIAGPNQMVGVTFRHAGNPATGEHYLVAWKGTTSNSSDVLLYKWNGSSYVKPMGAKTCTWGSDPCRTAPLPANKWFALIVDIVGNQLTVLTNKEPIADPTNQCSESGKVADPVNCNGNQLVMTFTFAMPYNPIGSAGLYFAGGNGYSDDLSVRRLPSPGTCGDGVCSVANDEDCINCQADCPAPCGCGDLVCAGDAEALGCRDDCFIGQVKYFNALTKKWRSRGDNVAAYWSFDDDAALGTDNSGNGMTLFTGELKGVPEAMCAKDRPNAYILNSTRNCVGVTGAFGAMFLKSSLSAYGKLPVSTVDFTITCFVKVTGRSNVALPASLIRWGDTRAHRIGLALDIRVDYGGNGNDGSIEWKQGLHTHKVNINWNSAGPKGSPLHHLAFVFDSRLVETEVYIDGVSAGKKRPCPSISVPQMVTFGEFRLGGFVGILDDVKILSTKWSAQQVGADAAGAQFVTRPDDIDTMGLVPQFPTPLPPGSTFAPTPALGPTSFVPTPRPTLGPMWLSPTPTVKTCKELCNDMCGGEFQVCSCHSPYARPTEVACDATTTSATAALMAVLAIAMTMTMSW
jgi:hypothetical protein